MAQIQEWFQAHQQTLHLLGSFSLLLLLMTLAAIPFVVMNLPEDYFSPERRQPARKSGRFDLLYSGFVIIKNLLGFIIIIVGLVLLFLPGQGIITILIGFSLTNFPGKFNIEKWIVRRPGVSGTLNWIRSKVGKPPLVIPRQTETDTEGTNVS
ncbi:MAG: hypothetical protein ACYTET_01690 [Planctomycetota bacterium]|jgi:hypothetical protein